MKQVSTFEIIAARCWNLLNEGKPFTPIFVLGVFLLYHLQAWTDGSFWSSAGMGLLMILPLLAIYYCFDFPLMLRNYLWLPLIAAMLIWDYADLKLYYLALGLFFFFTIYFWGTFYYHLRIGTSWWNFTRFWKLVLKNSDSTSGNAAEQMPKFLLLLFIWQHFYTNFQVMGISDSFTSEILWPLVIFTACVWLYSYVLHKNLFDWKPSETEGFTSNAPMQKTAANEKVIVIVIDGMRKDRFEEADAPFLKNLRANGTEYTQMETVYPARTVVCFSSMFTGTYPREHGIRSNMVWSLGIKVESIFDSLRKVGKKGRLLAIAHLIDAMGDDVESITAVMHNDLADLKIIERAKKIMEEQNPDFLVAQLIATDQTGHSRGALYGEYREKIEEADKLIAEFVGWLEARGMMKNTTLMICADHGQADGIGGHGHLDEGERYVPFFLHGPTIKQGLRVDEKQSLISVAPTVAYLLGAPYPSHSRGPVLVEAMKSHE
ncbi:alkaline phosphatase family protein [Paenibacillus psychroresistens]|uniref:Alkaline phosphatase family protein n=1 Tax=Paenibacillus psychroresistens TaxID=1778678 RepID=A0A6B8RJL0_9BACL|nr:alkaline phosphatase family protein [Paenibacillus psychroresistens]QGQ95586.1 alkaline phosphatase family protein [Paenibacillus psychroresistens]